MENVGADREVSESACRPRREADCVTSSNSELSALYSGDSFSLSNCSLVCAFCSSTAVKTWINTMLNSSIHLKTFHIYKIYLV